MGRVSSRSARMIAGFLAARLDELQALADAADPGPWLFEGDDPTDDDLYSAASEEDFGRTVAFTRGEQVANGRLMEAMDPVRALAIVAAGRKILADWESKDAHAEMALARVEPQLGPGYAGMDLGGSAAATTAMRRFAGIWADHPDCPRWVRGQ